MMWDFENDCMRKEEMARLYFNLGFSKTKILGISGLRTTF